MDVVTYLIEVGYVFRGPLKGFDYGDEGLAVWSKEEPPDWAQQDLVGLGERLMHHHGAHHLTIVRESGAVVLRAQLDSWSADIEVVTGSPERARQHLAVWSERGYRVKVVDESQISATTLVIYADRTPLTYSGRLPRFPLSGGSNEAWH